MTAPNLFAQQDANRKRTRWLVFGFILFFAWVGFGGDLGFYLLTRDAPAQSYHHTIPIIGLILTAVGLGICWYSFKKGPARVLWAAGAWEIIEPATPEQKQLVNVVEEMAIASGLPRPRIWVVPDSDPNAFATGLDQQHANIAVTEGLLTTLNRDELQAVIAHEMAHISNLDVRLMTLLAAMVGAIALMSDGMGRMLGRGGGRALASGGGRGGGSKKGGGNQLAILILVLWVITLILAPIISRILAMAVSRKREYLADASSAQFTRNPQALATALEKLEAAKEPTKSITQGAAHLCIVDPSARALNNKEGKLADFLASHPPMNQRIARLKGMAFQQAKRESIPGQVASQG
ncbi:MAG TPA: M48 family metallopeptidase [Gemmatimonadales bacterium]|jgi:heat shock protein HtpX|nr:M48 family metallopeptidase [Gemmatimonadales bacterium]